MSLRAPPHDYYEEDDFEYERERYSRPHRRGSEFEDEVEYRRRRSMPPVEDMERLRARERPPRDLVQESFAPSRERAPMTMRRPDGLREEKYIPPRRHRSPRPREIDEDILMFEQSERRRERRSRGADEEPIFDDERERRRGRHPREADEEDLILEERERRRDRRPREIDEEELIVDGRERHRGPHRREVDEEELIVDGRERHRGPHRREVDEEELIVDDRERHRGPRRREIDEEGLVDDERERHRGSRRREIDEEELVVDERERRRGPRPRDYDEENLIMEEKETRRIRRPRRMSEEPMVGDRERRRGPRPSREPVEDPTSMSHERERRERRRHRPDRDIEEDELFIRRREGPPPRGYESDGDFPQHKRDFEDDRDEPLMRSSESRRRPRLRGTQVEEIIIDDRKREMPPHGRRHHRDPRIDEEIIMRWKDRPSPRELDEEREEMRHRRHPAEPMPEREPPGAFPSEQEDDFQEGVTLGETKHTRSRSRPRRSPEIVEEAEEIAIHKDRIVTPPREVSPEPIRAPPIHQDVITHHRHIDHGYEGGRLPRAPSPEIPSTRTSFDEVDIHHRSTKGGRKSEDDIVFKHRDEEESISPTSGPSMEFSNPWDGKEAPPRRKPRSIDNERLFTSAETANTRGRRNLPRGFEVEKDIEEEEGIEVYEEPTTRSTAGLSKGTTDEWSAADTPSKIDAAEMSGALSVIEVAPQHAVEEELERDMDMGQQVEKEHRDERWTEITKELVVREAIERLGYEFEETRKHYYVFSFLEQRDIDELIELSDEVRSARRRRIREMQRERVSLPPPPRPRRSSLAERLPIRPPRMTGERRVREREWIIDPRRSGRF